MIRVELTQREVDLASFVAEQRNGAGAAAGADALKYGDSGLSQYELHVRGCLGELAAAKGLDRYWAGGGTNYHEDLDLGIAQVRTTRYATGRLLIRPEEVRRKTIDDPWILVIQHDPWHYGLAGWIIGREGIRDEYLTAVAGRKPAYFIPQERLKSFRIAAWLHPQLMERNA